MTLRYLLDTNAVSEQFRQLPSRSFLQKFHKHKQEIAISSTTWHELLFGVSTGRRKEALKECYRKLTETVDILAYDDHAAEWHAHERARLLLIGRSIPVLDGQIAAVAVTYDLTLVTHNTGDFAYFQDLTIEDWMIP